MRVLWATNIATPYRIPLWHHLNNLTELTIATLSSNEWNREWENLQFGDLEVIKIPTRAIRRGESTHYVATSFHDVGTYDAAIMPGWEHPASWQLMRSLTRRNRSTSLIAFNESTDLSIAKQGKIVTALRRHFFNRVDLCLTVSPGATRYAQRYSTSPIVEVPNTFDVELYRSGEKERDNNLVYCGQLIPRKAPDLAIKLFAQHSEFDRLDVVGKGELLPQLKELARDLGVSHRVVFHGHLPIGETAQLFTRSHTLLMPSISEVYGFVAAEAIVAGMRAIVSNVSGVAPVLERFATVKVAEPNLASMSRALHTMNQEVVDRDLASQQASAAFSPSLGSRAVMQALEGL